MHDYGTEAFILQYRSYVAIRGKPAKVTSDRGSQLTSKGNVVVTPAEHPANWGWQEVADRTAQEGTVWEFVPAGCQYRNGLAENRVKVVKKTLAVMIRQDCGSEGTDVCRDDGAAAGGSKRGQ